jgi:hypothetical protein
MLRLAAVTEMGGVPYDWGSQETSKEKELLMSAPAAATPLRGMDRSQALDNRDKRRCPQAALPEVHLQA